MEITAIFEKGPKPNGRNTVNCAAIYTCLVVADFRFEDFCGIVYKLGELVGETERIVTSPNQFSPNRTRRREYVVYSLFRNAQSLGRWLLRVCQRERKVMGRRTASHCAFRQIGTSNGQLCVASPKTPAKSSITGNFNPYLVLGDTSTVGCALGLTNIAHSQICVLESAISVMHSATSSVWTLPHLHVSHQRCVATQVERDTLSERLALRSRKNAPMLSNRDGFRHFDSLGQLRVAIRSVLGETRHNPGVLVVEMRHHSRYRQMYHLTAPSSNISRPCTLALQVHSNIDAPRCFTTSQSPWLLRRAVSPGLSSRRPQSKHSKSLL